MDRTPWLVVGADGAIGGELLRRLRSDSIPAIGTSRRSDTRPGMLRLDLVDALSEWSLPLRVEVAYLCAAVTSIEKCRQNPSETQLVNVERTLRLARLLRDRGAHVVFLSTNQVFDGSQAYQKASAVPNPQTKYGEQKAEVERELLRLGNATVVRFTKVMPPRMKLIGDWAKSLNAGHPIRPFHDMVMAPVPVTFAVEVLRRVGERTPGGIAQLSGDRDVSYAEVGITLTQRLGVSANLVQPISVEQAGINREAAPRHTTLDTTRLHELGLEPPRVTDTINALIEGAIHG